MTPYFVILSALWGGFLATALFGRRILPVDLLALLTFVGFAGLRFETGNDWVVYRDFYLDLPRFLEDSLAEVNWLAFEPLYVALSILFREFIEFQWFILVVVAVNAVALFWYCAKVRVSFVGVFAVYFAWVYLSTQMAAIRHSIALSIALVAIHVAMKRKFVAAFAIFAAAAGFHFSALMLAPLALLVFLRPTLKNVLVIAGIPSVGLLLFFSPAVFSYFSWLPFYEKIELYFSTSNYSEISLGALMYIALNLGLLFFVRSRPDGEVPRLAFWGTAYLLVFQVGLWSLPVYWNRVMALVIVFQACFLSDYVVRNKGWGLFVIGLVLSFLVLTKTIVDPAFVSYVPYQNVVVEEVFDVGPGDGEARFFEALDLHKERNVR